MKGMTGMKRLLAMRTFLRTPVVLVTSMFLLSCLTSCTTLSSTERNKLEELKHQGIRIPHEQVKNPGTAGALNILPGFGNFYLAMGEGDGSHWLYGFLNLLTWPYSIVWGIPEAAIDAGTINERNTVYYYSYGPGKQELEKRNLQPIAVAPMATSSSNQPTSAAIQTAPANPAGTSVNPQPPSTAP